MNKERKSESKPDLQPDLAHVSLNGDAVPAMPSEQARDILERTVLRKMILRKLAEKNR